MGSRGRSIRLRIYFLVAIPLITMLGLFGYVAYTSVTNWLNLDRAPSLIQATSEPLTNFVNVLQAERRAAVVYLSQPNAANLGSFQTAVGAARRAAQQVAAALNSPATKSSFDPGGDRGHRQGADRGQRHDRAARAVTGKKLAPLDALAAYTNIIAGQGAVLQAEANSIPDSAPVLQGLGLISAVNTQEDMSEQDAVLASALVSGSLTARGPGGLQQRRGAAAERHADLPAAAHPGRAEDLQRHAQQAGAGDCRQDLTTVQQAVPGGATLAQLQQGGLTPATWQLLTSTWLKAAARRAPPPRPRCSRPTRSRPSTPSAG